VIGRVVDGHQFAADGVLQGQKVGRGAGIWTAQAKPPQQASEVEIVVEADCFTVERSDFP